MVKFCNKHSWYAVQCRTSFLMDRSQRNKWIKFLNHHFRTAVRQTVHRCQNNTEAVKQRYAAAKFVVACESHAFACEESIVCDVMMCQHNAFRKTSCAGGVLHIDHVVARYLFLSLLQRFII